MKFEQIGFSNIILLEMVKVWEKNWQILADLLAFLGVDQRFLKNTFDIHVLLLNLRAKLFIEKLKSCRGVGS